MSGDSEKPNDGGPAYPVLHPSCQRVNETEMCDGMTLRDYFAAKMIPLCWSQELRSPADFDNGGTERSKGVPHYESAARAAYRMADAMLAERAKSTEAHHAD